MLYSGKKLDVLDMDLVYRLLLVCMVFAALAGGWYIHSRVTGGPDRRWSGRAGVLLATPAAVLFAVIVAVG